MFIDYTQPITLMSLGKPYLTISFHVEKRDNRWVFYTKRRYPEYDVPMMVPLISLDSKGYRLKGTAEKKARAAWSRYMAMNNRCLGEYISDDK